MDEIVNILTEHIVNNLSFNIELQDNFKKWIKKVNNYPIDIKRFFVCLAIDLKNGLVIPDSIIQVLREIDFSKTRPSPLRQFDLIINKNPDKYLPESSCSDLSYKKEKYVSVITWSKLFRKISEQHNSTRPIIPISINDHKFYYELIFKQKYYKLDKIKEFSGWKGLTWITSYEDLKECLRKYSDDTNTVNHVIDRLGLDPVPKNILGEPDKYIYIKFPDKFLVTCYQPTTLYGFWKETGGLYLSYKKENGYGKTYSTSGKSLPMKERVFRNSSYCNNEFVPNVLGEPNGALIKNRRRIIEEGLNRFTQ